MNPIISESFRGLGARRTGACVLVAVLSVSWGLAGFARGQSELLAFHGSLAFDVGYAFGTCGDIDGDGHPDILSADPYASFGKEFVLLFSGASGQLLHEIDSPTLPIRFGTSVAGASDLTGDGVPDILVGAILGSPGSPYPASQETGCVLLYSGATDTLVRSHVGAPGMDLGAPVVVLDDIDGDGVGDYAAGAAHAAPGLPSGPPEISDVLIWSGATGALITTHHGESPADGFGGAIQAVGDLDGDGVSDYCIGAGGVSSSGLTFNGAVYVYSGASGALLRTDHGTGNFQEFGEGIARVGDVDGDGAPDYATTVWDFTNGTKVVSGATGAILTHIISPLTDDPYFATTNLQSVEDWDGNGVDELVIRNFGKGGSHVLIADAKTGNPLYFILDDGTKGSFPVFVDVLGDMDGDGRSDLFVTSGDGNITEYSTVPLAATSHSMPVSGGQSIGLSLSPGAKSAGGQYFVLAGFTGTAPGFQIGQLHVPLNFDPLTDLSIALLNVSPFSGTVGTLNPVSGYGHAAFDMTGFSFPPSAVGITLSFAFVVRSPNELGHLVWTFASNPVDVQIVP